MNLRIFGVMLKFLENNIYSLLATMVCLLLILLAVDISTLKVEFDIPLPIESMLFDSEEEMEEVVDLSNMKDLSFNNSNEINTQTSNRLSKKAENVKYENISNNVENELKDLEQQFYNELASERGTSSSSVSSNSNTDNSTKESSPSSSNSSPSKQGVEEEEFAQDVGESYSEVFIENRKIIYERKPLFMCEGSETVWIDVLVKQDGKIESAKINKVKSPNVNMCFHDAALKAAKIIRFNRDSKAPKLQQAQIKYTFIRQ